MSYSRLEDVSLDERKSAPAMLPEVKLEEVPLPYLPLQMDPNHLDANGKLLSDDEIARIIEATKNSPDKRFIKKELKTKYSIVKIGTDLFAIYQGVKHNKEAGLGQREAVGSVTPVANNERLKDKKEAAPGKKKAAPLKLLLTRPRSAKWGQNLLTGEFVIAKVMSKPDKAYGKLEKLGMAIGAVEHNSTKKGKRYTTILRQGEAKGQDLWNICTTMNKRPIPVFKLIEIIIALLEETQSFHRRGWFHRDIKCENLICEIASGIVTLIDPEYAIPFSATQIKGYTSGTAAYAAPEVLQDLFSEESDVYALGKTIAFMLGFLDLSKKDLPFIKKSDAKFVKNPLIPDKEMRGQIYDFLLEMTRTKFHLRPKVGACIEKFKSFQRRLLEKQYEKVGIVDVGMYLDDDGDLNEQCMAMLRKFDKVILVNTSDKPNEEFAGLRNLLETAQVILHPKIIQAPGQNIVHVAANMPHRMRSQDQVKMRSYFYVGDDAKSQPFLAQFNVSQVTPGVKEDLQKITRPDAAFLRKNLLMSSGQKAQLIENLEGEIKRLKNKYGNGKGVIVISKHIVKERIEELRNLKSDIQHDRIVNFHECVERLNQAKKAMVTTSCCGLFAVTGKEKMDVLARRQENLFKRVGGFAM